MAAPLISDANQVPTIMCVPDYASSSGIEAIDLARSSGLMLDPWQQIVLEKGLAENKIDNEWLWAAFEVAVTIARQNGKGSIIEARELAGLFLFDEELIIHTAHEFKTASEAFARIRVWIEGNPDLESKVMRIITGKGSEAIQLLPKKTLILPDGSIRRGRRGNRLRFLARNESSGRGFTCNCLILDESMHLGEEMCAALVPTLSAIPNSQIWYAGSAGIGDKSTQLAKLRARAIAGSDQSLAYLEWHAVIHEADCLPSCKAHGSVDDERLWLRTNPGLPYRRRGDGNALVYMRKERASLGPNMFARERLTVGDYPDVGVGNSPIKVEDWLALAKELSLPGPDLVFAVDVSADRKQSVIISYSVNENGIGHVEVIDRQPGTDWIAGRMKQLKDAWNPLAFVLDGKGPGKTLIPELKEVGISQPARGADVYRGDLLIMSSDDMQTACGLLVDAIREVTFYHLGDEVITASIQSAAIRPVGDAWVWTRRNSTGDISSLVAVTMAKYGFEIRSTLLTDYDIMQSAY